MNRYRVSALGAIVLALSAGAAALTAAQPGDNKAEPGDMPAMTPDMAAMMKLFEDAGKPGVQHELLKQFAGTFDAKVSMWMPGVEAPSVSTGTMVNTLNHGGRYLHHEYKGEFDGADFTGSGDWGFNNTAKRWEGTWMDSMSTAVSFNTGTLDGKRGEWTMKGEWDHPLGYRARQRDVIRMAGPDAHSMTSYTTDKDGIEQKVMEIAYTRRPDAAAGKSASGTR